MLLDWRRKKAVKNLCKIVCSKCNRTELKNLLVKQVKSWLLLDVMGTEK
jgi:hypothetical protein